MKVIYYITTAILSVILLMGAGNIFFNNSEYVEVFTSFGYPAYLVYPKAIAQLLAVGTLWGQLAKKFPKWLIEWAYAGMFFQLSMALAAHMAKSDGEFGAALVALVAMFSSYFLGKKVLTR